MLFESLIYPETNELFWDLGLAAEAMSSESSDRVASLLREEPALGAINRISVCYCSLRWGYVLDCDIDKEVQLDCNNIVLRPDIWTLLQYYSYCNMFQF